MAYVVLAFLFLVAGVSLLVGLDWWPVVAPTSPLHYLGYHMGALLSSIGLVGIAFEFLSRFQFGREWLDRLRTAFAEDPKLAQQMSDRVRQERVKITLQAQLDPDTGGAIFDSIVLPYMQRKRHFRKIIRFDAHLMDLENDVRVERTGTSVDFTKADYHKLKIEYRFTRVYERRLNSIAIILMDEYAELTRWFQDPNALYREVVAWPNLQSFRDLVAGAGQDELKEIVRKLASVNLRINDWLVPVHKVDLVRDGKAVVFRFRLPIFPCKQREVEYFLSLESMRAKSMCRLPLLFPEPALNPVTYFSYPASVKNVIPAPFFGGDPPYARVHRDDSARHILVEMPRTDAGEKWIFPPAGVIFTWERT